MELLQIDGKGRVSVMESVTGFEHSSISPNPAGKLFMNTDLDGFGRRTSFAAKSQDFSPHKMFMNTNSGLHTIKKGLQLL
jgi:hypothetical protein